MNPMRHWLNAVQPLCETQSIHESKVVYRDHEFMVIQNPTKRQVETLAAKADHGEGLRAILSFGDLYVWDGYYANHDEIGSKLHLSSDAELHLWDSYIELDAIHLRLGDWEGDDEEDDQTETFDAKELADRVRANPCIVRIYGHGAQVKADFGDREEWV